MPKPISKALRARMDWMLHDNELGSFDTGRALRGDAPKAMTREGGRPAKSPRPPKEVQRPERGGFDPMSDHRAMQSELDSSGKQRKPPMPWWWSRFLRILAVLFVAGYIAMVAVLIYLLVQEKSKEEASQAHHEACQDISCPFGSTCVVYADDGSPSCSIIKNQNAQTLGLILGLVLGLPGLVCVPCVVQHCLRRLRSRKEDSLLPSTSKLPEGHVSPAETVRPSSLGHASTTVDELRALFASPGRPKTSEAEDNDSLDGLFGRRGHEAPKASPAEDESALDGLFSKGAARAQSDGISGLFARPKATPEASHCDGRDISNLFARSEQARMQELHLRRNADGPRSVQGSHASGTNTLKSDASDGLSMLFGAAGGATRQRHTQRQDQVSVQSSIPSGSVQASELSAPRQAPDFFAFALRVARLGEVLREVDDAALQGLSEDKEVWSTLSGDSLDATPDALLDLFHPPCRASMAYEC